MKGIKPLEQLATSNAKNVNAISDLLKILKTGTDQEKLASLHSLRRIFIEILESKRLLQINQDSSGTVNKAISKLIEYKQWILTQLNSFKLILIDILLLENENMKLQTSSIRTLIEFVKCEYLCNKSSNIKVKKYFGQRTFHQLIEAIINIKVLDIDILLMIRSEILSKVDCSYHTLKFLCEYLDDLKQDTVHTTVPPHMISNILDLLRVISIPSEEDVSPSHLYSKQQSTLLVFPDELPNKHDEDNEDNNSNYDDENDSSSQEDYPIHAQIEHEKESLDNSESITKPSSKKRQRDLDLLANLSGIKNKKIQSVNSIPSKRRRHKLTTMECITKISQHKLLLNRSWMSFLSLPNITISQHKLILKHLAGQLISDLSQPILLADYLTQCYGLGGVVAVLALESLFQLVLKHNLDYPRFFESLYALCTPEIFSAKYRSKFMNLLSMSLKSTNLPIYKVAAFIKRLTQLALTVPPPSSLYCIAQITWLLREHQECSILLHRENITDETNQKDFDNTEIMDLLKTNALSSSLWELEALILHYSGAVSELASALKNPFSTIKPTSLKDLNDVSGNQAETIRPFIVEDFINQTYESMIEAEIKKSHRKQAPLSPYPPTGLWNISVSSHQQRESIVTTILWIVLS